MQEVFEKIKQKLEEENKRSLNEMYRLHGNNYETVLLKKHNDSICAIVDQVAEEYGIDGYDLKLKEQYINGYEDGLNADKWIPCSERLPEEHDSIFAKAKGTNKWNDAMFEKCSDDVLVTVEGGSGDTVVTHASTTDGKWMCDLLRISKSYKITYWQPLPAPPKKEV